MKNFGRVLRMTLRYRGTFLAATVCALLVGVLWGGNIGTVYPFIEVAFRGESLEGWVTAKIQEARAMRNGDTWPWCRYADKRLTPRGGSTVGSLRSLS